MYGKRMDTRQVAEIYLQEMPPLVESLRKISHGKVDFETVKHRAHSLVGSFSMLCAEPVASEARNLEQAAAARERELRLACAELAKELSYAADVSVRQVHAAWKQQVRGQAQADASVVELDKKRTWLERSLRAGRLL